MKTAYLKFDPEKTLSHIKKEIYGHFSEHLGRCIYNGIYVGKDSKIPNTDGMRNDVIEALKEIKLPVLRWPGGCYADEYHWHDGVGKRTAILNSSWGGVVEDNSFGTHEFFRLCELLGCEPYIAGNMGSGTVRELSQWMEYMTSPSDSPLANERRANGREEPWQVPYLGIGNESWGCGGNMTADYYTSLYKQYAQFAKSFNGETLKVAVGPNTADYDWTENMMKSLSPMHTGAISLHYYTFPTGQWEHKGAALTFDDAEYYNTMALTYRMEELLTKHGFIMDKYDPEHKIGLIVDEWGCWYDVEEGTNPGFLYQQNAMRDALVAAVNLNIFNNHSDRVIMANLAQIMNVLQSVLLSDGETLVKTPTWYAFKLFVPHQEAELVKTSLAVPELYDKTERVLPMITQSLSKKDGSFYLTLSNCSLDEDCSLLLDPDTGSISGASAQIITADVRAFNDFDGSTPVAISDYSGFSYTEEGKLNVTIPAHSVVAVRFTV